jgi:hypothetical protein
MSKINEFFALSINAQKQAFATYISNQRINDKGSLAYKVGMINYDLGIFAHLWKRAELLEFLLECINNRPYTSLKKLVSSDYVAGQLLTIAASQAAKAQKQVIKERRQAIKERKQIEKEVKQSMKGLAELKKTINAILAKPAKPARQPKAKPINGALLYKGPSAIDGQEIAVIIVGLANGSSNTKTGSMLQTYIIRTDIKPIEAANNGQDVSVCGDCKHRPSLAKNNGEAKCYVNLGKGAGQVFKALQAGNYPAMSVSDIAHLVKGKEVRFGTYGDPCAAPIEIFEDLAAIAAGFTGYTHRWRDADFNQAWSRLLMASVDNIFEQFEAVSKGYRYFRVQIGTAAPLPGEISCPASAEAGKKTTCAACLLCGGTSKKAKNIVIQDHAIGWQGRQKLALAAGLAVS